MAHLLHSRARYAQPRTFRPKRDVSLNQVDIHAKFSTVRRPARPAATLHSSTPLNSRNVGCYMWTGDQKWKLFQDDLYLHLYHQGNGCIWTSIEAWECNQLATPWPPDYWVTRDWLHSESSNRRVDVPNPIDIKGSRV